MPAGARGTIPADLRRAGDCDVTTLRIKSIALSEQWQREQTLLIVDDHQDDRAAIRRSLVLHCPDRRYRFIEASDGDEALSHILGLPAGDLPDCVLLDLNMPRMNGLELVERVVRSRPHDYPPLVVLTSSDSSDDAQVALTLGAQDYISKLAIRESFLSRIIDNAIQRHCLLRRIQLSERQAAAAVKAKTSMIGHISHEIRTPMTAVLGLCELLATTELNSDQQHLLQMVRDNGQYMMEIVSDLLDLSKMEVGSLEIEPSRTDLKELLADLTRLLQNRADEKGIELRLEIAAGVPKFAMLDELRVRQVLINLLSNAIKFTQQGHVALNVRQELINDHKFDGVVKFEVIDTGCGIEPKYIDAIFEPFVQAGGDSRTRSTGTGLGLAICRRLITAMNGTLAVDSRLGEGSSFRVDIPYVSVPADLRVGYNVDASFDEAIAREALNNAQVLIADDARATTLLMERFLNSLGAKATIAENGEELINRYWVDPHCYDCIITDVQMPRLDGLSAISQLRASGATLPILVLTADAFNDTREAAMAAGATDVLTKPFLRNDFLHKLTRLCSAASSDR